MKDYVEFSNIEFEEMNKTQEAFMGKYEIEIYSNWFYDQESELLRLRSEIGSELYFKYVPIGTYSLKSKSWMWSWENIESIESSKYRTLDVRNFGEKHEYRLLTEGLFNCDVDECWKLTAISKKLIGGVGVYCAKSDDLLKYMILLEHYEDVNSKDVKRMNQMNVDCGVHGFRRAAFICQHLNLEQANGFEEAFETERGMELTDDEDFGAWCNDCETIRSESDGWNDVSEKFAKIKLICEECYFELKEFSEK